MPRPTKRFGGLVLGAGVLFAIGTNIQSGWLLVLSSLLLGAATAGLVLPPRMVRHLRIERRAPAEVFQGQPANVDLLVANAGRGMRLSVVLEDEHLAGIRVLAPSMRPGERVALSTERAASRRGAHESSTVWVSSSAPFGVAVARRRLEVPSRTIVFPAVVPIRQLPVVDGPPDVDRSAVPRPRRGAGPEYLGVRDYHVGDSLRHVHWPTTARRGALMVRELEQEHARRITIVVDTFANAGEEWTPLDLCCSVAASVALEAVRLGHRVRLAAAAEGALRRLDVGTARGALVWLAELAADGGLPMHEVVSGVARDARGGSLLLALPSWDVNRAEWLIPAVAALRGTDVSVALVDASGFEGRATAGALPPDEVERLAGRLAEARVSVYRLSAGDDPAEAFDRSVRAVG